MLAKLNFPDAEIYLQGAHLTRFKDWLYLSSRSNLAEGKSIRGGIPVVFPWFGSYHSETDGPQHNRAQTWLREIEKQWTHPFDTPKRDDSNAPQHGWARTSSWNIERQSEQSVTLAIARDEYYIRLRYDFGDTLGITVRVENHGSESLSFEVALHTYFAVSAIAGVEIEGLEGLTFIDKPSGNARFMQDGPVKFDGEVDRIYLNAPSPLRIRDGEHGFELSGDWLSAVIWNPGEAKAATMKDVGQGEWQKFVCLEVGAIADNEVSLEPKGRWTMNVQIARF